MPSVTSLAGGGVGEGGLTTPPVLQLLYVSASNLPSCNRQRDERKAEKHVHVLLVHMHVCPSGPDSNKHFLFPVSCQSGKGRSLLLAKKKKEEHNKGKVTQICLNVCLFIVMQTLVVLV